MFAIFKITFRIVVVPLKVVLTLYLKYLVPELGYIMQSLKLGLRAGFTKKIGRSSIFSKIFLKILKFSVVLSSIILANLNPLLAK